MIKDSLARHAAPAWCGLLSLLVLAPVLMPGYVLSYDMVFVPHQTLLPWMMGISGGLPRSVPQDALVALISGPIPGQLLQKAALFAALLLAGIGVARLLNKQPLLARLAATTLMLWNPFVAERLVLGHWSLLLAYGALAWVLGAVIDARQGKAGAIERTVLWASLASIVPTGGLLAATFVVPALVRGSHLAPSRRLAVGVALVIINVTWWLPAVLNPSANQSDSFGATAFALRSENWGGPVLTALGLGGVWNGDIAPATRVLPWVPIFAVIAVVLAAAGVPPLLRTLGRAMGWWLVVLASAGLLIAIAGAWSVTSPAVSWIVTSVPGGGTLRDGQKWLAPLALLIALAAPLGLPSMVSRFRSRTAGHKQPTWVLVMLIVAPIAILPDLAWGVVGRLVPVSYPPGWDSVRSAIASGPPGDAISLPWSAFRSYPWNAHRTVLDPAPRFMTRTVIVSGDLPIATPNGIALVSGDDPKAEQVGRALESGEPLASILPRSGIRWVIEQADQPEQLERPWLAGLDLVVDESGLLLWQIRGPVADEPAVSTAPLIIAADVLALLVVLGAAGTLGYGQSRRRS